MYLMALEGQPFMVGMNCLNPYSNGTMYLM